MQVAKVEASRDWTPEYVPPSMLPDRFKKGQFLRKASSISAAMILKVTAVCRYACVVVLCGGGRGCFCKRGRVCVSLW